MAEQELSAITAADEYIEAIKKSSGDRTFAFGADSHLENVMKDALAQYLDENKRKRMTGAERVFLKALVLYLAQAKDKLTDEMKRTVAQAFDYLHGRGKFNYDYNAGRELEGRPGVGMYLANVMGLTVPSGEQGVKWQRDAYRACLLDAAARLDASLAVIPVDQWEVWGKQTPVLQCSWLAQAKESGELTGLLKKFPSDLVPSVSTNMPELMTVDLLLKVANLRPGQQSFGFQEMIARSLDDPDMLKVLKEVIIDSDDPILVDAAVNAYKEDDIGKVSGPDELEERSPTNDVPSTFDLIREAQKAGAEVKVDMARLSSNPKEMRRMRKSLLCFLGRMPTCATDCGKCELCLHNRTCRTCGRLPGKSCSQTQRGRAKQNLWKNFLAGRLESAVDDMYRRSSGEMVISL